MAATKRPAGINFEKILQSLKGDIQEMIQEYQESNLPITDDSKQLHRLCDRLEFVLNFGIKERSMLGGRRDLWQYFCKCLAERRNILEGLKIVKANRELKTSVGRSRSFLRYCLVHQCLADVIQQCTDNKNMTSYYYSPEALLLDAALTASLIGSLYQLCDVPFDLPPTGHDLDVSWPTYSRPGSSAWRAPSRTVSMSSLSSFSSQLSEAISYQSPPAQSTMAPVGEDEPTHDCPSSPTSPVSPSHTSAGTSLKASLDEVSELHQRLAHLEDDNASLRASCVSLQLKLDQATQDTPASQDSNSEKENSKSQQTEAAAASTCCCEEATVTCSKCSHLREELALSQNRCKELESLHQKLEDQIKLLEKQVEDFDRKESEYKCQISTLELKLNTTVSDETDRGVVSVSASEEGVESDECVQKDDVKIQQSSNDYQEQPETVEYYRRKLETLEKKYDDLQEQYRTQEKETTIMRTNIHKISEAEEKLKQKVTSLSQFEEDYKALQEDLSVLTEKFEERGRLLHIANDRVNQLEKELQASKKAAQDNADQLNLAKNQANEFRNSHEQLNCEYKDLKEEVLALQQQIADLRFQVSSHTMEKEAAKKSDMEKSQALEAASAQLLEQKTSLVKLQEQTASQKEMLQNERDQLTTQVEKLNRILVDRDRECTGLSKHLKEAEVALKSAKDALSDTRSKLGTNEEESKQLNEDNMHLREKIIQLLREKDALWQANVRLEGAATGRAWMDNKSTQECLGCNVTFSLTRRRHHCRSCGRIFCTGCSDNWINTAASSRRVRVCDDCFSIHAELATIIATPAEQTNEETRSISRAEGAEASGSSQKGRPLPIGTKMPDDEEFSVISDDELQNSRLSSSPSSSSPASNDAITETRATVDILTPVSLSESPPTNAEVWVGAATRVLVPADLPAGVTLHWNFSSEPKSISFAVLHQPPRSETLENPEGDQAASQSSQQRVLIPTTRVATAEGATVKGRLQTKQPGVYTLVFDNSCSRFTAKRVTYSLRLENSVSAATSSAVNSTSSSPTPPSQVPIPKP